MNTYHYFPDSFIPPFCPNPNCLYHRELTSRWRFKKTGFYYRKLRPRRIQRFTCLHCRRSFSSQTFSTSYWQKRPELARQLFTKTTGGMANRQAARDLKAAPETISRQLARLGRHCMLFHARMMQQARPPSEIVIDGFVSFEFSQYFPFHHHLAVEKDTDFLLYFTDSPVRRSGRMTSFQKSRREELETLYGRPDPQAVRKDMTELLQIVCGQQSRIYIHSDDHRDYPKAIKGLKGEVLHIVTSSKERRDNHNKLWAVNLLDLLIRHSSANHKRETIAWSKRRQASAERLAVFLVWRNYVKGRREKVRGSPTPAMERGMCEGALTVEAIVGERIFPTRMDLPPRWQAYYERSVQTRVLSVNREHGLNYAA